MNTLEQMVIESLYAEYQKPYDATQEGCTFPTWFTDEQLNWIKNVVRRLEVSGSGHSIVLSDTTEPTV